MSENQRHTPSPWVVVPTFWAKHPYDAPDKPQTVAEYWIRGPAAMGIRNAADAYLIAAAPALLAACERIIAIILEEGEPTSGEDQELLAMLRDAVALARPK